MLAPFGADSNSLCQRVRGKQHWVILCEIYKNAHTCLTFFIYSQKFRIWMWFLWVIITFRITLDLVLQIQCSTFFKPKSIYRIISWSWSVFTQVPTWDTEVFFLGCWNSLSRTAVRHWAAAMRYLAFSGRKKSKLALHSEITQVLKLLTALKQ